MRIATWNVNSIRARLDAVKTWLESITPDIVLLQEIKAEEKDFPHMDFYALGYKTAVLGQKSYNGVAILSRHPIESVQTGLPTFPEDPQARYIEATIKGLRVASLYAPNGNPTGTEKYTYKLEWMARLKTHIQTLLSKETSFILGGDFNVLPEDRDAYNFALFAENALGLPATRKAWQEILYTGCIPAFRTAHPHDNQAYSFWEYTSGAWQKNMGLRLDDYLLSPDLHDKMQTCIIDKAPRALEKASDHVPVLLTLES